MKYVMGAGTIAALGYVNVGIALLAGLVVAALLWRRHQARKHRPELQGRRRTSSGHYKKC